MVRWRAFGSVSIRGRHLSMKRCAASRSRSSAAALRTLAGGLGLLRHALVELPLQVADGVGEPAQVHVLARDDVLIRVVEVVVGDDARIRHVAGALGELVAVELPQELQHLCGFHELCFSLQVMQTRVHGMALRRAAAIGSPQSRQMP